MIAPKSFLPTYNQYRTVVNDPGESWHIWNNMIWDLAENGSNMTNTNDATFQDVCLNQPPPPYTQYKIWATTHDSLQQ